MNPEIILDFLVGLGVCAAIVGLFWPIDPLDPDLGDDHERE